jgi:hypothetical protein
MCPQCELVCLEDQKYCLMEITAFIVNVVICGITGPVLVLLEIQSDE